MTVGSPEPFRGGQGIVDWLVVIIIGCVVIAAIIAWRHYV